MAGEIKKVYQHIKTKWKGNNSVNIKNGYFFKSLDNVMLRWVLQENGLSKETGTIGSIALLPQQENDILIPIKSVQQSDKEYQLNIYYVLKTDEPFLPKDFEIAAEQFLLKMLPAGTVNPSTRSTIKIQQNEVQCSINGKNFSILFDLKNGILVNYKLNGEEVMQQGPIPSFWRAPTDNDIGAGFNRSLREWRNAYENGTAITTTITKISEEQCQISFTKEVVNGDAKHRQVFTIYSNGTVKVDNYFNALRGKHLLLLRAGNDVTIHGSFKNIQWYGRGPGENYWDRKTHTFLGQYKQTLDEQYYPYARPQESGNHTEVRWVTFSNARGRKIHFAFADSLLSFSALPYRLDDLDPEINKKQYHSGELTKRDLAYLHIDLQQTGLQGIDSWGSMPLVQYRVPFKDYRYSYWMNFE